MKKIIVIVVLGALAALVGWQVHQRVASEVGQKRRGRPTATVAVDVAPVVRKTLTDVGEFAGSLDPRSQFDAAAKVAGRLEELRVNLGDTVRRGQVIAVLDDEEFTQQVAQARAELDVAKATVEDCASALTAAESEFKRTADLWAKKIASDSEKDADEAKYKACLARQKVAQAQVQHRQAALSAAEIRLSYTQVRAVWELAAPIPGAQTRPTTTASAPADEADGLRVVAKRYVDDGALLKANDPIVSIIDDRVLIGVIHVIERDYPKVAVGQPATITTDAHPGRSFPGRIARISPLLATGSRQGRVEIEVPNADRVLKAGYYIRARIAFAQRPNATIVPATAVVKRDGREGVFLADPATKTARFVPVMLGVISGDDAEVLSPALDGLVVTLGQHLLENGSKIILAGAPATRPARIGSAPTTRPGGRRAEATP